MTTTHLELINQYRKLQCEVKKTLRGHGLEVAKGLFKEIFDQYPGLKAFVIQGYTPEFNDGEPCTHSQNIFVGRSWSELNPSCLDFLDENNLEEFFNFDAASATHINNACTKEQLSSAVDALEGLEEILRDIFDTNFELRIRLENTGLVEIEQEDYDCGY